MRLKFEIKLCLTKLGTNLKIGTLKENKPLPSGTSYEIVNIYIK